MSAAHGDVAGADWDAALQRIGGHFLQSALWQRVQVALGHQVVWSRGERWLWSGAIRSGHFPRYLYVPHGPTSDSEEAMREALSSAMGAARERTLDFVRAEPAGDHAVAALTAAGAVVTRAIQPRWTWVLDLTPDLAALRGGLSAGHRGSVNAAKRRGLEIDASHDPGDIEVFIELQRRAGAARGFAGQPSRYHRAVASELMPAGAATLYIARVAADPVAAALCFDFNATRYYAHAVSDPDRGRRLGAAAPLVWQMIADARGSGALRFDFWGISPDGDQRHRWAGFSQFKRAFGGEAVLRAGTFDLPVRRLRHQLYRAARRLRR